MNLGEEIALEAKHYHAGAQVGRFLAVFFGALAVQLLAGGSIAGWSDLRAAVLAALPVAYRQLRKTMPVPTVQRVVSDHEAAAAGTATAYTDPRPR